MVRDGRVPGVDLPALRDELMARLRAGIAQSKGFVTALGELERAVATHFEAAPPCC